MRRLILTADDFGLALPVNEAIEQAHHRGVLTCASLMAAGPAADDAVARARRMPGLGVGLHVVVVRGVPLSAAGPAPARRTRPSRLPDNLVAAGVRYFFSPRARTQLEDEIRAQFEWFAATGLELDHVNAHCHMHVHPTVLNLILKVGREFGLRAMRVPDDPAGPRWLRPWIRHMRRKLRQGGVRTNDFLLGLRHSGAMDTATVLRMLRELPDGVSEMYFHPAIDSFSGAEPNYRYREEFEALLSARVREAIEAAGLRRIRYRDLLDGDSPAGDPQVTRMGIS
ncbi:MAG: hopanoid biosynthesis-associated protein HpnK [Bryobacterales bacterium]|nr:hopanoid biosynthesis-associated protein HpnK [Bryobacteraceae bacterium]MDW8355825.1 hopanoid biosynthesis-associated protein HpnK [Bryobacterales bacterium]